MIIILSKTDKDDDNPESDMDSVSNGRSTAASPGPWFDRILGGSLSNKSWSVCLFVCLFFSLFNLFNNTSKRIFS